MLPRRRKSLLFDCDSLALRRFGLASLRERHQFGTSTAARGWSTDQNRLRGSMFPKPRQDLVPNTAEFERLPFVKATGFREYDARWRYPEEINLLGLEAVGLGARHADARNAACRCASSSAMTTAPIRPR